MKPALIAIALVGLILGSSVRADLEEGQYAPDLEAEDWLNTEDGQPISLSNLKGMTIVLYFWVSWHEGGERFIPAVNQIENMAREHGVFTIGVTDADRSRIEDLIKEEHIFFPIALECKAAEEYEIRSFPHLVIIDAAGQIAYSGDGKDIIQKLQEIIEETPVYRTHPREATRVRRLLDQARAAYRQEDYRLALIKARKAYNRALTGDKLKTECQEMIDLVEALGRDRLARAIQLIEEQDYTQGVTRLRDVIQHFRVLKVGKRARKRLESLREHNPEVKRTVELFDREAKAGRMLLTITELLWARSFGEAHESLETIVNDLSDTKLAAEARKILRRMKKNKTIMGYIYDYQARADCENWLAQAYTYRTNRDYRMARKMLRRIIDKYPDTIYREMAYQELGKLP